MSNIIQKKLIHMKTLRYLLLLFSFSSLISCNVDVEMDVPDHKKTELSYDSIKAQEFGADEYGMKKYVMAFLKKGPNRNLNKDSAMKLQMAHLENIGKMAEEGKLVLAGPFFGDQELRGIYIFNVETIEEAEALTKTDPAIKVGSLEMELLNWYGSAALVGVNDIHQTLSKKAITEE
jgi:uncharacterized protein YciI